MFTLHSKGLYYEVAFLQRRVLSHQWHGEVRYLPVKWSVGDDQFAGRRS